MKRTITSLWVLLLAGSSVFAQSKIQTPANFHVNKTKAMHKGQKPAFTGLETSIPGVISPLADEAIVGSTTYDLQTNSSAANRMHNWGGGNISTTWTYSAELGGFTDRGTGYNKANATVWGPAPSAKVESIRTGFPAYTVTPNGDEFIFSHGGPAGAYLIHYAYKAASSTTWQEANVPTTTPAGGLWCRAASGGADGRTIHVIYLTAPTGNSGVLVDGLNGTLKYCRSTDNGATWDIVDQSLPGLDTDHYLTPSTGSSLPVEGYSISANGDAVAIGMADFNGDCLVWKSNDNGGSWEKRVVNAFPLTKWDVDVPYTFDDIAASYDPNFHPDSLALFTSDETGNVFVDPDGIAHFVYSGLFIQDTDTTDGQYTWYPYNNGVGIVYWNELMSDNAGTIVGYSNDVDGDGDLEWNNATDISTVIYTGYGEAFNSGPSLGRDADGRLYVTYSSSHEGFYNGSTGQYFHSPWTVASEPNDYATWLEPHAAINDQTVDDLGFAAIWECYFANMAPEVDDHAHIMVMQDFTPGSLVRSAATSGWASNDMVYLGMPVDILTTVGTKTVTPAALAMSVAPNPVEGPFQVKFQLENTAKGNIEIVNTLGAVVRSSVGLQFVGGSNVVNMDATGLNAGVYMVKLNAGGLVATEKILVVK